ncbi:MAG: UDP-glucuronic acid decarboxylase family protein [Gemmatirosa sp.]
MRVLITGAAGFLGSHLTDRVLADGHAVVGVDNFLTGEARNVAHLAHEPRFELLEQDVSRALCVAGRVDAVLHLASPASPVDYYEHPIATLDVGSAGTRNALAVAHEQGARFLLASTSEVYGDPHVHPQPESYWGHVSSIGPRSCYDEAKRFAEAMTMAFHRHHGVDTRIVRIFNTYGPRMRPRDGRVVSNFIVQALRGEPLTLYGDGSQTRSFCYVDDEVEGLYRLLLREPSEDSALPTNIGNPDEFTVRELATLVQDLTEPLTGARPGLDVRPLPQDDPRQRRPDITRARETLGWAPRVPLREGLAWTIAYFAERLAAERHEGSRTLGGPRARVLTGD